tara:strand:- start:65 stop:811 length:747 start_codon:yes stop_codon:yes gene_type:complete
MKYITKYKSPNYNSRKNSKIKLIIIHYTALKNIEEAISFLCKKEKKVSSHYLIGQNGSVYSLVNETHRAWHAGKSFWQDNLDINAISIGIELDYNPYGINNKFSLKMLASLKKLILYIQIKYKISKTNVLGHSEVAPYRKKDPGKHFPWKVLLSSKIILNFENVKKSNIKIIEKWFFRNNIKSKKKIIIISLSLLGYDTDLAIENQKNYNKLINVYKIRYLDNLEYKNNILLYNTLMKHLFKFLLTKT